MNTDQAIDILREWHSDAQVPSKAQLKLAIEQVLSDIEKLREQIRRPSDGMIELQNHISGLNAEIRQLKQTPTEVEKKAWQLYSGTIIQKWVQEGQITSRIHCMQAAQDWIDFRNSYCGDDGI